MIEGVRTVPLIPGGSAINTALQSPRQFIDSRQFALAAAELAANTRCENVIVLDLRGRSPVTEYFVIATGTSARQMRTVADELSDLGKRVGFRPLSTGGYESARWIIIDFISAVVHVFDTDSRDFYDLELLWGDSPRVNWRQELGLPEEAVARRADREAAEVEPGDSDIDEEERRLEGDAEIDEDADSQPPVVVELADESTGSNSVEFVEIDSPAKRGDKRAAVFPVTIGEEDAESDVTRLHPVEKASLDEDARERFAEAAADIDPEARAPDDLPDERLQSVPMGGVSVGLSSTTIIEDDEDQQRDSVELDDAGDNREEAPHAAASAGSAARLPAAPHGKRRMRRVPKTAAKAAKSKPKAKAQPKSKAPAKRAKPKAQAKVKPKTKAKAVKLKARTNPKAKSRAKAKPAAKPVRKPRPVAKVKPQAKKTRPKAAAKKKSTSRKALTKRKR